MNPAERMDARKAVMESLNSRGLGTGLGFDDEGLVQALDEMARKASPEDAKLLTDAANQVTGIDRSYAGDMAGGATEGIQVGTPLEKGGQVVLPVTVRAPVPRKGASGNEFIEKTFYIPGGYEPISSAGGTKPAAGFRYNPEAKDFSAPVVDAAPPGSAAAKVMKSRTLSDADIPIIEKGKTTRIPEEADPSLKAPEGEEGTVKAQDPAAPPKRSLAKTALKTAGTMGAAGLGIGSLVALQNSIHQSNTGHQPLEGLEDPRKELTLPEASVIPGERIRGLLRQTTQLPFAGQAGTRRRSWH